MIERPAATGEGLPMGDATGDKIGDGDDAGVGVRGRGFAVGVGVGSSPPPPHAARVNKMVISTAMRGAPRRPARLTNSW